LSARRYRRRKKTREKPSITLESFMAKQVEKPKVIKPRREVKTIREERETVTPIESKKPTKPTPPPKPKLRRVNPTLGIPCETCGRSSDFVIIIGGEEHFYCYEHIDEGKRKYGLIE